MIIIWKIFKCILFFFILIQIFCFSYNEQLLQLQYGKKSHKILIKTLLVIIMGTIKKEIHFTLFLISLSYLQEPHVMHTWMAQGFKNKTDRAQQTSVMWISLTQLENCFSLNLSNP